ncbi:MAG: PIG-L family deacetylase [Actinomycetota bacterium]|nr:PIG-L family deacetylase [Actinomycetota bacterium]
MNVLVLAPHPDDEVLGCGGTLAKLADRGASICVTYMTSGEAGLPEMPAKAAGALREGEAARAAAILGVEETTFLRQRDWHLADDVLMAAEALGHVLAAVAPDAVFLPHADDGHGDHAACLQILTAALAASGVGVPEVLGYEIWTPLPYYDVVEDVSATMSRKLQAMRAYASQLAVHDYVRAAEGLGSYRGALVGGTAFAEVFKYETVGLPKP